MFSHVTLGVSDVERACRFYGPVRDALGWVPRFADGTWAGWQPVGADRPLLIVTRFFDGLAPGPGNGAMVALAADSRAAVDACHARALDLGGADEGSPGPRPQYHPGFYGGYFRDADGNKLCVCCHEAR